LSAVDLMICATAARHVAQRQLPAGSDPRRLAFELGGVLLTASWYFHLYAGPGYLGRARRACRAVRGGLASEAILAGGRALQPGPADR